MHSHENMGGKQRQDAGSEFQNSRRSNAFGTRREHVTLVQLVVEVSSPERGRETSFQLWHISENRGTVNVDPRLLLSSELLLFCSSATFLPFT